MPVDLSALIEQLKRLSPQEREELLQQVPELRGGASSQEEPLVTVRIEKPPPPGLCQHLRTKKMYLAGVADPFEDSGSTVYWCMKTMTCPGADGGFVSPEDCREHRPCFEPRD